MAADPLECSICFGLQFEAMSFSCGHSVCGVCAAKMLRCSMMCLNGNSKAVIPNFTVRAALEQDKFTAARQAYTKHKTGPITDRHDFQLRYPDARIITCTVDNETALDIMNVCHAHMHERPLESIDNAERESFMLYASSDEIPAVMLPQQWNDRDTSRFFVQFPTEKLYWFVRRVRPSGPTGITAPKSPFDAMLRGQLRHNPHFRW